MIGRIRLCSGVILFVYVVSHLLNHSFGIVSLQAMDAANRVLAAPWRNQAGLIVLATALTTHVTLALYGLYRRRQLTLKPWELAQLLLGLAIPMLLAAHVTGTRVADEIVGLKGNYSYTMAILWILKPSYGVIQVAGLLAAWVHGCIGMHMWLRLKRGYARWTAVALSFAVLLPAMALAGYVSAGVEVLELAEIDGWLDTLLTSYGRGPEIADLVNRVEVTARYAVVAAVALVLLAREVRRRIAIRRSVPVIRYLPGDVSVPVVPGATVLETVRGAGLRHASVCGGRGRCSTCRVRVDAGRDKLDPPDDDEARVLDRLGLNDGTVRLACQLRPTADLMVTAMLPHEDPAPAGSPGRGHETGEETEVAILFVDLRGSTQLSEARLPFDVVFILNQFFAELSLALDETDGHYAQFNGDGLMALYGLDKDPATGCRDALSGAGAMLRRIAALSERLGDELDEPLKIGIGIHFGEAIVGSMGPPRTPIVSALGDNVNIAARLEAMTKELGVQLCVSAGTLEQAGIDAGAFTIHEMPVKGRERPVRIVGFDVPPSI